MDTHPPPPPPAIQLTVAQTGPDMAGSDGLVNPIYGNRACAYCVQIDRLRHSGAMRYSPIAYSTSHRSEVEGVYNTLLIKKELCSTSPITQHVDNDKAINASRNTPFYTQCQAISPKADIIMAIHTLHSELTNDGGNNDIQWIKSHQDNDHTSSSLSPTSQLSLDMDTASKQSCTKF